MNAAPIPPPTVISSLVCHAHVDMAVDCLGSIARHCDEPVRFQIHDDGSLTCEDQDKLTVAADVQLVLRGEADDRMADELRNLPAARALREELPLALKLFDTVFFHPGPDYAFADSDVLFLRPFVNPFRLPADIHALFMEDRENCYCFRSWGLLSERSIQLPACVNTGLVVFRRSVYDPEALEWFLSRPAVRSIPGMREQTAWAFLGQRVGCRKFSQQHARIMREGEPDGDLIAGHFTARSRHLLPQYVQRSIDCTTDEGAEVETVDAGSCGFKNILAFELRRAINKLTGRRG